MRSVSVLCGTALVVVILTGFQTVAQDRRGIRKLTMPELVKRISVQSEALNDVLEKALSNTPMRGVDSLKIRNSLSKFNEALERTERAAEKDNLRAEDVGALLDAANAVFDWIDSRAIDGGVKTERQKLSGLLSELANRYKLKLETAPGNKPTV